MVGNSDPRTVLARQDDSIRTLRPKADADQTAVRHDFDKLLVVRSFLWRPSSKNRNRQRTFSQNAPRLPDESPIVISQSLLQSDRLKSEIQQAEPIHRLQLFGIGIRLVAPTRQGDVSLLEQLNDVPAHIQNPITDKGATLGRVLFYDKNLSRNNTVSCSSCHQQAFGSMAGSVLL